MGVNLCHGRLGRGNYKVTGQLLIQRNEIDINAKDNYVWTSMLRQILGGHGAPLSWAADKGREAVA